MSNNTPRTGVSRWWLALSIFLAIVLALAWATGASMYAQFRAQIVHLEQKLQKQPQVREIAVLLDAQQQAALLVTHDPTTPTLQLQRLNSVREGREDSLQLWALRQGQAPRSLGVVSSGQQTPQLTVAPTDLQGVQALAISVENKGGVPEAQGPRLPWLWQGTLVTRAL
ncbi:MAG: hypothetical protein RL559_382 [Pseudomonadota bacterium]|jgi:anti-sigma-K factor RskA